MGPAHARGPPPCMAGGLMLVSTGAQHRRSCPGAACCSTAARTAMEAARRALDEPGLPPGDSAWAEHERLRVDDEQAQSPQACLVLREAPCP